MVHKMAINSSHRLSVAIVSRPRRLRRAACLAVTLAVLVGCSASKQPPPRTNFSKYPPQELWCDVSQGPYYGQRNDGNSYFSDYDRYPEFGIVSHVVNVSTIGKELETSAVCDAIGICRQQFSSAYETASLLTYDHFQRHRSLWKNGVRFIPFHPKWVVIIIENHAKLNAVKSGSEGPALSANDRERLIVVGYVFSAARVFDKASSLEAVLETGFRDERPLRFDMSKTAPIEQEDYLIVDHFAPSNVPKDPK